MQSKQSSQRKKQTFIDELMLRAKEQHVLMQQNIMPRQVDGMNRWLSHNTLLKIALIAYVLSTIIFVLFFNWFYVLGELVVGK